METERVMIRQKALDTLQESTKRLELAEELLEVGNVQEAERLQEQARKQRNISVLLMAQARRGEVVE
jgi:hypothetical protein